jgi:DNA-binding NarL/FixJ family response regulator
VLLVDDHPVIRLGLAASLGVQIDCEVCAEVGDGREAIRLVESLQPDVAVIDIGLPGLNGLDLTGQIRRRFSGTEVVLISGDDSADTARRAMEAGAKAFMLKVDAGTHLGDAVRAAGEHRFYLTSHTHEALRRPAADPARLKPFPPERALTSREREVVQLLAEGKSNKEAAGALGLSVKTIETHRAAIMRKLSLARPSDLVRYAIRHKIIAA